MKTVDFLSKKLEDLSSELYDENYGTVERQEALCARAEQLCDEVLDHFGLSYFNPGEPCAEGEDEDGEEVQVALTCIESGNFYTCDEEERALKSDGDWSIPEAIFWGRVRLQHAENVIEFAWQSGNFEQAYEAEYVADLNSPAFDWVESTLAPEEE